MNSSIVVAGTDILASDINNFRKDIVKNSGDYGTTTGSANTYILALDAQYTAYVEGDKIKFKINVANTGASTININSIGAKSLKRADGSVLVPNDLVANRVYEAIYDGTNFIIFSLTNEWTFIETITFSSSSAEQIAATFTDKTAAQCYKVVFTATQTTASTGVGQNEVFMALNNDASGCGSTYNFSNMNRSSYPSFSGTTSKPNFSFVSDGGTVLGWNFAAGEVIIPAQGAKIPVAANITSVSSGYSAVMVFGDATLSGGATSVSSISFSSTHNFSGTFKIYRKNI